MNLSRLKEYLGIVIVFLGVIILALGGYKTCNCYRDVYYQTNLSLSSDDLFKGIPSIGNNNNLYVVEFVDPQCPYSRVYYGDKELVSSYVNYTGMKNYKPAREYLLKLAEENKIKLYSVDFPLERLHPGSLNISANLYCIYMRKGDKEYYKIRDKVYTNETFLNEFKNKKLECGNETLQDVISNEIKFYQIFGISGTPTIVLLIKNPDYKKYIDLYRFALRRGGIGYIMKLDGVDTLVITIPGAVPSSVFERIFS